MIRNLPPSPNSLLPTRDIIDEIVPTDVKYIVLGDEVVWLDYRDVLKAELRGRYGDRAICYCNVDRWVRHIKAEFTPETLSMLGKQVGIYKQDREPDTNYASYTITESGAIVTTAQSQAEDIPDVPADGTEYLSARGKSDQDTATTTTTTMLQETGPLQAADFVRLLITNMYNPLQVFVRSLDKYFIPFEWMC